MIFFSSWAHNTIFQITYGVTGSSSSDSKETTANQGQLIYTETIDSLSAGSTYIIKVTAKKAGVLSNSSDITQTISNTN